MVTMLTTGAAAAAAETALDDAQIDGLLTGNTVYLDLPAGGAGGSGGTASFLYRADGRAIAKLPTGTTMRGKWRITGRQYCVDWDSGLKNSCTRLVKSHAEILFVDAAKGEPRGRVLKIVPGNPENL